MVDKYAVSLRLIYPQWQAGNDPGHHFGSQLLAWLSPTTDGPVESVHVETRESRSASNDAISPGYEALRQHVRLARSIINEHAPDRIVTLGGDCSSDLAPIAYLNERYEGELAVLWIGAESAGSDDRDLPCVQVMEELMGVACGHFACAIKRPLKAGNFMFLGAANARVDQLGIRQVNAQALAASHETVLQWFQSTGARQLAIHLELPALHFSPGGGSVGCLSSTQILPLLRDLSAAADVVGLGVSEYLPREVLALRDLLAELPLITRP